MWFNKVKLPTTEAEYDALIDRLLKKYRLKDRQHAGAILSVAIRHLPPHQAYCTLDYLGHSILKNLAYQLANHRSQVLQHEIQVKQLETMLAADPNNQQALDELEKAAREGSLAAKGALERVLPKPEQNVVAIN